MFKRQSGNAFVPSTTSYSPCPPGSLTFCNSSTDEAVSRYPQTRSSSLRLNRSHVCRDSLLYFARAEQGRGPVAAPFRLCPSTSKNCGAACLETAGAGGTPLLDAGMPSRQAEGRGARGRSDGGELMAPLGGGTRPHGSRMRVLPPLTRETDPEGF